MNILRLKELMIEKGISGKDLAEKTNVSQNTISNIVKGKNFPKPALLLAISEVLDVDIKELFISTKEKDLNSPQEALKEIQKILNKFQVNR